MGLRQVDMDVRWGDGNRAVHLRVVGIYFQKLWRLYLTTVPRKMLGVPELVKAYRLRWLIEFLFREWKQQADCEFLNQCR